MKTKETSIFNCENGNNENSTFHLYEKLLKKNEIIPFSKLHYNTNIKKKNLLIHFIIDKEINNNYLDYFLTHILLKNKKKIKMKLAKY